MSGQKIYSSLNQESLESLVKLVRSRFAITRRMALFRAINNSDQTNDTSEGRTENAPQNDGPMQIVPEADPEKEGTQLGNFSYLKQDTSWGSKEHLEAGFSPSNEANSNEEPCHKKMLNNSRLMILFMLIVELHNVDKYDRCKFRNQTARVEANVLMIHRHPRLQDLSKPQWDLGETIEEHRTEMNLSQGVREIDSFRFHLYCQKLELVPLQEDH